MKHRQDVRIRQDIKIARKETQQVRKLGFKLSKVLQERKQKKKTKTSAKEISQEKKAIEEIIKLRKRR